MELTNEENRTKFLQRLINIALNNEKVDSATLAPLLELLDKLIPDKTEPELKELDS